MGYPEPLHASNVHIPIGLVVGAVVFVYIAVVFNRKQFSLSARHCLVFAFIWLFPTAILGIMDWQHFYHGAWLLPIIVKLILAPTLAILMVITIICAYKIGPTAKSVLILYVFCLAATGGLGFFGGRLVFDSAGAASKTDQKMTAAGQTVFSTNCASCHPKGGNVVNPDFPLKGSSQLQNFKAFVSFIRDPRMSDGKRGEMPPFSSSEIPDIQARHLYDYITRVIEKSPGNPD